VIGTAVALAGVVGMIRLRGRPQATPDTGTDTGPVFAVTVLCIVGLGIAVVAVNVVRPGDEDSDATNEPLPAGKTTAGAPDGGDTATDGRPAESAASDAQRKELRLALAQAGALLELKRFDEAAEGFREAMTKSEEIGDAATYLSAATGLAEALLNSDKRDAALEEITAARQWADDAIDGRPPDSLVRLMGLHGAVLASNGQYAEAIPILRQALALAEANFPADTKLRALVVHPLVGALERSGDTNGALAAIDAHLLALKASPEHDLAQLALMLEQSGRILAAQGRYREAIDRLKEGIAQHSLAEGEDSVGAHLARIDLAHAFWKTDDKVRARSYIEQALKGLADQLQDGHPARIRAARLAKNFGVKIE
jgi:tetratricopeptide (TPR) repeat protein